MAGTLGNWDLHADGSGARNISTFVTARSVAQSAENMAIPTGAKRVILSFNGNLCVDWLKTAVVPADDDTGIQSEMLAVASDIQGRTFTVPVGATNLSVIAPAGTVIVTASWFY